MCFWLVIVLNGTLHCNQFSYVLVDVYVFVLLCFAELVDFVLFLAMFLLSILYVLAQSQQQVYIIEKRVSNFHIPYQK